MVPKQLKSILVTVFSLNIFLFYNILVAQPGHEPGQTETPANEEKKEEKLNPAEVIMEHIKDAYDFHFFTLGHKHYSIPLPVILYSPQRGFTSFMSSNLHHGEHPYNGYQLVTKEYLLKNGLDLKKFETKMGRIIPVGADGRPDDSVKLYDVSLTKNVVQLLIAVSLLMWIMIGIARRYKRGEGVTSAPTGLQNAIEPIITFVRDDVAKPNLGAKYQKYMPYLLTVFFFILINNIFGLIPGLANVTGNIAFTAILGIISFVVILFSTTKHYWAHIFNPPVPGFVKPIFVPVEFLSVFTKPFALIVRLFANMVAGHIIILSFICLIFIFGAMSKVAGWGFAPLSVAFAVFIYLIEILVVFIQAFIFTNLTAVFIGQAFEGEHHDEHHGEAKTAH
jgi:F-type H+-transporting ATPase subunit a